MARLPLFSDILYSQQLIIRKDALIMTYNENKMPVTATKYSYDGTVLFRSRFSDSLHDKVTLEGIG